jgi:hypothetical protein
MGREADRWAGAEQEAWAAWISEHRATCPAVEGRHTYMG